MDQEKQQENLQPDSTRALIIDEVTAVAEGYEVPRPVPQPVACKYCGKELHYFGLLNPMIAKHVIIWKSQPERCTCERAQEFWTRYDAREAERKAKEAADAAAAEEMRRFESLMARSGMKGRFQNRRFDNFVQDTDGRKQAYAQAKKYAENFQRMLPRKENGGKILPPEIERNGLMIAGTYGTGKTHLAAAIANELISRKTPVICMTMIDLLDKIRETYSAYREMRANSYDGEFSEAALLQKYQDVPLLIIDDIGSEQPTEWGMSKIFAIINSRYEGYMPTIVTTNYSGDELERRMTPDGGDSRNAKKTLDRLKEMCVGIEMAWDSWRIR